VVAVGRSRTVRDVALPKVTLNSTYPVKWYFKSHLFLVGVFTAIYDQSLTSDYRLQKQYYMSAALCSIMGSTLKRWWWFSPTGNFLRP
jgi:hypothetical protein